MRSYLFSIGLLGALSFSIANHQGALLVLKALFENFQSPQNQQGLVTPLNGTYTIGNGMSNDYPDIQSALTDLDVMGISDTTRFLIQLDTIIGGFTLPTFSGMGCSIPIIFEADTSVIDEVLLFNSSTNNQIFDIEGNGFHFKLLTFGCSANATVNGGLIRFSSGGSCNIIEQCKFYDLELGTSSTGTIICNATSSQEQYNIIKDNIFYNGYTGIYFNGVSNNLDTGNVITNNQFFEQRNRSIILDDQILSEISKNQIRNKESGFGIELNRVRDGVVTNNFILVEDQANNSNYGLGLIFTTETSVINNTIRSKSPNANSTGIYFSSGTSNEIFNNIFSNEGPGTSIRVGSGSPLDTADHNLYFTAGTHFANFQNTLFPDLSSWSIALGGFDTNSFLEDPLFTREESYFGIAANLNGNGSDQGILEDIESNVRNIPPDIGALEFDFFDHNLLLSKITPPATPFNAGVNNMEAHILNIGNLVVDSYTLHLRLIGNGSGSSVKDTIINLSGRNLAFGSIDTISIPFNFQNQKVYTAEAWTYNPNGMSDAQPINDTLAVGDFTPAMEGSYTIGITQGEDFSTIDSAILFLNLGGILDTTTFILKDSIYNEQISFDDFPGNACSKPVTFISDTTSNDTSIVSTLNENTCIIDGADGLVFKFLTFECRTSSSHNEYSAITFKNAPNCNVFENNLIKKSQGQSDLFDNAIVFCNTNNASCGDYNTFRNNQIRNGEYAFYIDNNLNESTGWEFQNNQIDSVYTGFVAINMDSIQVRQNRLNTIFRTGIVLSGTNASSVIENYIDLSMTGELGISTNGNHNIISKDTIIGKQNTVDGIHIFNGNSININRNIIDVKDIGIRIGDVSFINTPDSFLIKNNFIISENRGIYLDRGNVGDIVNNSIRINGANTSSRAYYQESSVPDLYLINNIFSNFAQGYAIYCVSSYVLDSDHNDLYSDGSILGYYSGNQLDLSAWQNATSQDVNSISVDPLFVDSTNLHIIDTVYAPNCIAPLYNAGKDTLVLEDIDGQARFMNPEIGADEYQPISVGCDDGDPCTNDFCDPITGACVSVPGNTQGCPCDDGIPCTTGDAYNANGFCVGTPIICDDGNPCTDDSCDPVTGVCIFVNNTAPCTDGNACTVGDHCSGGVCVPGTPRVCDDGLPCTTDSCDPLIGCVFTPLADNTPCDDGSLCTTGDVCIAGLCIGTPINCDDGNSCTLNNCDPAIGCINPPSPNGTPCDDGDPGTVNDACDGNGNCTGTPINCDDGNPCTDDFFDSATGMCMHVNNTAPCSDGNACTAGDHCSGGVCVPGASINCDDGNPCTTDSCNPILGCVNTPVASGTICDDGDPCTTNDVCDGMGNCAGVVSGIGSQKIVTTTIDSMPGCLRFIVENACPGDTIVFDPAISGLSQFINGPIIIINKDLTILGSGPGLTTIHGSSTYQVFSIQSGNTVAIEDIVFLKSFAPVNGGALINYGTLYLKNVAFIGNQEGMLIKPFTNFKDIIIEPGTVLIR